MHHGHRGCEKPLQIPPPPLNPHSPQPLWATFTCSLARIVSSRDGLIVLHVCWKQWAIEETRKQGNNLEEIKKSFASSSTIATSLVCCVSQISSATVVAVSSSSLVCCPDEAAPCSTRVPNFSCGVTRPRVARWHGHGSQRGPHCGWVWTCGHDGLGSGAFGHTPRTPSPQPLPHAPYAPRPSTAITPCEPRTVTECHYPMHLEIHEVESHRRWIRPKWLRWCRQP